MKVGSFSFTPREAAWFSGSSLRSVEKAIEERLVPTGPGAVPRGARRLRRLLPLWGIGFLALAAGLPFTLNLAQKRKLARMAATLPELQESERVLEIAPAVHLDAQRLAGAALARAEAYRRNRDRFLQAARQIQGGAPVIAGTRIRAHSLLSRIEAGDRLEEIQEENPDLPPEATAVAVTFARINPVVGRPAGERWSRAA